MPYHPAPPEKQGRRTPTYMALAQSLMADIRTGIYPVGSRLPTENELCKSLQVSRHTVRDALRILVELGLVQRRPRAGTTVIAQQPGRRFQPSMSSMSDLALFAGLLTQKTLTVDDVVADNEIAAALGIAPGTHWRRTARLRFFPDDEVPLIYSELYVPQAYENALPKSAAGNWESTPKSMRRELEERYGVRASEASQRISAVALPPEAAAHLQAQPGAPGLELLFCYLTADNQLLAASRNLFRADRYSYSMRLQLRS